ncbi:MAG TPA: hypothetical protein VKG23_18760, partial [Thermoanaerobaculia bacterium]|nr:hypothetical protein [Thermoanaerobaculia bacterium]
ANASSDRSVVYASVFNGFPRQASTSRSTDGGVTWTQLTALGTSIVYAFGVDSTSSDVVYAAVGASDGGLPAGLYRSSDGGTNWAVLSGGLPNDTFTTIVTDPTNAGIVYAGTNASGLFRSTDEGNTWSAINQGLENTRLTTLAIDPQTPSIMYAGTYRGAFRSTDSGEHWLPIGLHQEIVNSFAFDPASSSTVYVGSWGVQRITFAPTTPCVADAQTLCLNGGRFRVQATFRSPTVTSGVGQSAPISDVSGSFWFFDAANLEIIVKVLDGSAVNDHFWVLYGALSDVEFSITVTDAVTGAIQSYFSQQNPYTPASVADITALPASSPAAATRAASPYTAAPKAATAGLCTPDASTLCLLGGRFQARVEWKSSANAPEAAAPAVSLTDDTGYYWFFDQPNVELTLKVLDGTAINGHFWVFYASLSNVAYTVTVTDLQTGAERVYDNPAGQLLSVDDTKAF